MVVFAPWHLSGVDAGLLDRVEGLSFRAASHLGQQDAGLDSNLSKFYV